MKRLTIGSDLQIYFDEDDKPKFSSTKFQSVDAVQQEIYVWQAFVEVWLEKVEKPRQERLTLLQNKVLGQVMPLVRFFRKNKVDDETLRSVFRESIFPQCFPALARSDAEAVVSAFGQHHK